MFSFVLSSDHAVVVAAVLEGLLAFAELAAKVHLPSEAEDDHVAVVATTTAVLVRCEALGVAGSLILQVPS